MTIIERQKLVDARRRRLLRPQVMSPAIGLGHCDGCGTTTFLADLTSLRRSDDPPSTRLCSGCLEARHVDRERRRPGFGAELRAHTDAATETILRATS